jgi:hypothetical protein
VVQRQAAIEEEAPEPVEGAAPPPPQRPGVPASTEGALQPPQPQQQPPWE